MPPPMQPATRGDEDPAGANVMVRAYLQSLGAPLTAENVRRAMEGNARVGLGRNSGGDAYFENPRGMPQQGGPAVGQSGSVAQQVESGGPPPQSAPTRNAPMQHPARARQNYVDSGSFDDGGSSGNRAITPNAPSDSAASAPTAPDSAGFNVGRAIMDNIFPLLAGGAAGAAGGYGLSRMMGNRGTGSPDTSAQPRSGPAGTPETPAEDPNIIDYTQLPPEGNRFNINIRDQMPQSMNDPMAMAMNKAMQPAGGPPMQYDPATGTTMPKPPEPPPPPADVGRVMPPQPPPPVNAVPPPLPMPPPQMPPMKGRIGPATSAEDIGAIARRLFSGARGLAR